jgi:hypothetical protein
MIIFFFLSLICENYDLVFKIRGKKYNLTIEIYFEIMQKIDYVVKDE